MMVIDICENAGNLWRMDSTDTFENAVLQIKYSTHCAAFNPNILKTISMFDKPKY